MWGETHGIPFLLTLCVYLQEEGGLSLGMLPGQRVAAGRSDTGWWRLWLREPRLLEPADPRPGGAGWETGVTLNSLAFVGLSPQRVLMLFEDNFSVCEYL